MKEYSISRRVRVLRPLASVFPFFADARNLQRLTPPELAFRIDSNLPIAMRVGALIDYTIGLYRIPMKWRTEITGWNPPHSFEDTQLSGPYRKWVHTHRFTEDAHGTIIEDHVTYALPFGILGRLVHPLVVRQLKKIFDYRETVLARYFA